MKHDLKVSSGKLPLCVDLASVGRALMPNLFMLARRDLDVLRWGGTAEGTISRKNRSYLITDEKR